LGTKSQHAIPRPPRPFKCEQNALKIRCISSFYPLVILRYLLP